MIAVLAFLLGCGTYGLAVGAPSGHGAEAAAAAPAPVVGTSPRAGATDVPPNQPVTLTADHARLAAVVLQASGGGPVAGTTSPDGRSWRAQAPLQYGTTYTWSGQAVGDGGTVPVTGSFSTVDPARTTQAQINIDDGETVGIAAPIIVQFDHHVADKAAAERAMTVQTSIPTTGSWAWLDDDNGGSRAHWRPQGYWAAGTQVSVAVHQFGVDDGGGIWGAQDVSSHFTVGRAQIVKADVNSHEMIVVRDGKVVMDFPASYGLGSDPNRNTTNGIHVVMSKAQTVLMSNPKYGYNNVPEHWAVRIENNGEFIHANPLTDGVQGSENVTHGCVNLSTENAQQYFDTAIFGDPVEVTNSPVPLRLADGDIADWTVPWDQWVTMSALAA
ncbi:Ig-like domain-containing protein [Actinomycetospora sp. TBRC 11914]|uniref:L,D-transpeptidase n=1 Tax=Actinomycetospora sp. TBRC 11914 TaxID=2729387 RepID=UPI00145C9085|nr:Ig-like domain-containing protein [Actinomycetospora sp. TBRC 11914]NMO93249.1 L,D-transpeptidase [Actinomycetospora sp. TBRC 11914]